MANNKIITVDRLKEYHQALLDNETFALSSTLDNYLKTADLNSKIATYLNSNSYINQSGIQDLYGRYKTIIATDCIISTSSSKFKFSLNDTDLATLLNDSNLANYDRIQIKFYTSTTYKNISMLSLTRTSDLQWEDDDNNNCRDTYWMATVGRKQDGVHYIKQYGLHYSKVGSNDATLECISKTVAVSDD